MCAVSEQTTSESIAPSPGHLALERDFCKFAPVNPKSDRTSIHLISLSNITSHPIPNATNFEGRPFALEYHLGSAALSHRESLPLHIPIPNRRRSIQTKAVSILWSSRTLCAPSIGRFRHLRESSTLMPRRNSSIGMTSNMWIGLHQAS